MCKSAVASSSRTFSARCALACLHSGLTFAMAAHPDVNQITRARMAAARARLHAAVERNRHRTVEARRLREEAAKGAANTADAYFLFEKF